MAADGRDSPFWCAAGVAFCGGGGDAFRGICLMCAHEHFCPGAAAALPSFVDRLMSSGGTLLDDSGSLSAEVAGIAVRAYVASCGSSMDPTGGREWDCSRMLASLLTDAAACAAAGVNPHPCSVLELGAGDGSLALALTADPGFSSHLDLYMATDVEGRVDQIQQRVEARALAAAADADADAASEEASRDAPAVSPTAGAPHALLGPGVAHGVRGGGHCSRGIRALRTASLPWGELLCDEVPRMAGVQSRSASDEVPAMAGAPSGSDLSARTSSRGAPSTHALTTAAPPAAASHQCSAFDLILLCELLYYKGSADLLGPLAATLASACRHGAVALVAFRERSDVHEADFFGCAREKGIISTEVDAGLVAAHAPSRRDGHGGRMVLMRLTPGSAPTTQPPTTQPVV